MARRGSSKFSSLGVALAMLALAFAAPITAALAASQVAAGASLTIRAWTCPASYAANAYAADCDEPFDFAVRYTAEGPTTATAETDAAGSARFAALPPGAYVVDEGDIPFEFIDRLVVSCAPAAAPGTSFPSVATDRGVRLDLGPGEEVVCDFFYVGADLRGFPTATLTIHNRLCPAGFSGPDYYAACHGTPALAGLEFTLDGPDQATASTDEAGNTAFQVAAGRYQVRGGVPGEFATLAVYCAPAARPGTPFPFALLRGGTRGPDDPTGIALDLGGGDHVLCDWYNTPESGR